MEGREKSPLNLRSHKQTTIQPTLCIGGIRRSSKKSGSTGNNPSLEMDDRSRKLKAAGQGLAKWYCALDCLHVPDYAIC
jgi:hypothetical protein